MNPWDRSRTPGASSAGEAAAIATGMSPLGLGNDGLGSLRHPAQCCGVSALKPTLGRIPHATTVEADGHGNDRHAADASQRPAGAAGCGPPGGVRGRCRANLAGPVDGARAAPRARTGQAHRVAIVLDPAGRGTAKQVQDGVRKAAHALEQAGYAVDELEPPAIDAAAKALVVMLTPLRASGRCGSRSMPPSLPARSGDSCRRSSRRPAILTLWRPSRASSRGSHYCDRGASSRNTIR